LRFELIVFKETTSLPVPVSIAQAGPSAAERFLEYFAANIRNPNIRLAYARAVRGPNLRILCPSRMQTSLAIPTIVGLSIPGAHLRSDPVARWRAGLRVFHIASLLIQRSRTAPNYHGAAEASFGFVSILRWRVVIDPWAFFDRGGLAVRDAYICDALDRK